MLLGTAFYLQIATEAGERERDVYEELLTQAEIQGNVNKVNGTLGRRQR